MPKQKFRLTPSSASAATSTTLVSPITGEHHSRETEKKPPVPALRQAAPQEENVHPLELKYISRKKIVFHEQNDFEQKDIEKLAESILTFGLIHPMEAYYDAEQDLYILESGERRTRAIDLLLERYLNAYSDVESLEYKLFLQNVKGYANGYPLNVKRPVMTESGELTALEKINSLLRLNEANLQVREIDPLSRATFLQHQKNLLQKRNELLPKEQRVNVLEKLAEKNGFSKRTVMKYTSIAEKLIPELQAEFQKNHITLDEGSAYAQLTEEEQQGLLEVIQRGGKVSQAEIKQLREELQKREQEKAENETQIKRLKEEMEKEQERLAQMLQAQEAEKEQLEKSIHEKFSAEQEVTAAERDALKSMLKKKDAEISEFKKKAETTNSETQKEISALQKKIANLEAKPLLDPKEQKIIKLTVAYEANLKTVENAVTAMLRTLQQLISLQPEKKEELISKYIEVIQIERN